VSFRISDIFLPGREHLFVPPPDEAEIEGTIVDFSDSGLEERAFAVVEVISRQVVVLAPEKLKLITPAASENE
jgi:hypothetical protein